MNIVLSANAASFSAGIDQAQRQLDKLAGRSRTAGLETRKSMEEARGAAALLGEEIGVRLPRHVRSFIAEMPGVSRALSAAFSATAVIGFGIAIFEAGEKLAKFIEDAREAPEKMEQAFGGLANSQRMANDELRRTDDRLKEQIATLEGKPYNGVAVALDDARIAADKLADSLEKSAQRFQQLMSQYKVGGFAGLFEERKSTTETSKALTQYQNQEVLLGYRLSSAQAKGDQPAVDDLTQRIRQVQEKELEYSEQRLAKDQAQSAAPRSRFVPFNPNNAPGLDTTQDQILLEANAERIRSDQENQSLQKSTQQDQQKVDRLQKAKEYADARKKLAAEDLQAWRDQLEELKSIQGITLQQEAQFWLQRAMLTKDGALARAAAMTQANKVMATMRAEDFRAEQAYDALEGGPAQAGDTAAQAKTREDTNRGYHEYADNLSKSASPEIEQQSRQAIEFLQNLNRGIATEKESSGAMAELGIRMGEATGQLTKLDAAQLRAQLHTDEYRDSVEQLEAAIENAKTMPGLTPLERQAQVSGLQEQGAQMQSQRMEQAVEDQQAVVSQTVGGASKEALDQMVQSWDDMASQIADTLKQTVGGFNDDIVRLLTQRHIYKGDISNAFGQTFREAGGSLLRTGLQRAESSVLGAFHLGGEKKPTGAQGDPLYVVVGNFPGGGGDAGPAQSVAQGITNQIFGNRIPGVGRVSPGQVVGDFFTPPSTPSSVAPAVASTLQTVLPGVSQLLSPAASAPETSEQAPSPAPAEFLQNFPSASFSSYMPGFGQPADASGTPNFGLPGVAPDPGNMLSLAPSAAVEQQDAEEQGIADQPITVVTKPQPSRWPGIIQQLTGTAVSAFLGGGFSGGGRISGPGSGTSDSIPASVSHGEFVVRAGPTARHLPLLHAINSNRFADGGLVGSADPLADYPSLTGDMSGFAASAPRIMRSASTGGDVHLHTGPIDARGASDPAATEAAINRAMQRAIPQAAALGMRGMKDQQRRRPSTAPR